MKDICRHSFQRKRLRRKCSVLRFFAKKYSLNGELFDILFIGTNYKLTNIHNTGKKAVLEGKFQSDELFDLLQFVFTLFLMMPYALERNILRLSHLSHLAFTLSIFVDCFFSKFVLKFKKDK